AQGGHTQGLWGTYRSWQAAGAQVRRGERATTVVLWRRYLARTTRPAPAMITTGGAATRCSPAPSLSSTSHNLMAISPRRSRFCWKRAASARRDLLQQSRHQSVFEGDEACYRPSTDTVCMPPFARFRDAPSFYAVWAHELGGRQRPTVANRDLNSRFGS